MPVKRKVRIHQLCPSTAVGDAVTGSLFFTQSLLRNLGFESEIYSWHAPEPLRQRIQKFEDLRPQRDDIVLIHHSMGHNMFSRFADLNCRKFLIYHNITPPEFFQYDDLTSASYAIRGLSQLSEFRDFVEAAIAISAFNAQQLIMRGFEDVTVIPMLKDFASLRYLPHAKTPYYDEAAIMRLLFVGRTVPHKCQHELIEFVDRVRSLDGVTLGLVLVGNCDEWSGYKSRLDAQVRRRGLARNVRFTGTVTDAELFGWYRSANVYLSLSEHEGFGIPLVEAMAFDLPVIAYASSGVTETLGDAGIAVPDKEHTTLLDALIRVCQDRSYRSEIIRSQRRRVLRFSRQRIETELARWLIAVGALDGAAELPELTDETDEEIPASGRTHYVIEGPYETSYSLAIVNRNIALAIGKKIDRHSSIEPADGTEYYCVDDAAANKLPPEIRQLVASAPLSPEPLVTIRNTYPPRPNGMLGDLRLVHLAWEESAIPAPVAALMNLHADGVLVPSEYCRRVIRNSGVRVPIGVIGHGIDHLGTQPQVVARPGNRGQVTRSLPFTFLHVSSGIARKGIEELITAYCLAFSCSDPVLLVIKTFDSPDNTIKSWITRLSGESRYAPAIQVICEELEQPEMDFLYHVSDALVLPTRGEGFNLPAAEAMGRGVPVIATRHSGHLDYCNSKNSWLLDFSYEQSTSHLNIPASYWARPSVDRLIEVMRQLYREGRASDTIGAAKAEQAQHDARKLQWSAVGERVEQFVNYLNHRQVMKRKLRLGWISTYNTKCGIASYSEYLLEHFDHNAFDVTIIADGQAEIGKDPENVVRIWQKDGGDFANVTRYLINNNFDIAVFQHNLALYDLGDFADALISLADAGIQTFATLHRTKGLFDLHRIASRQRLTKALQLCSRVFVHGLADVNDLREQGVTDNVVLLTHGVHDRATLNADGIRTLLGLAGFAPIIGTFGFLLPGKGLPELVYALGLMLKAYPDAYLLMINAEHTSPESREEHERVLTLIRFLELEDRVRLISEFLDVEEVLFLLSACDAIVYPYQQSDESASGAIRLGLSTGRLVLSTPLPVFADLADIVHQLPGTSPAEIAEGTISLLQDSDRKAAVQQRQGDWVRANSWANQAARISNIIRGCWEEGRGVELRVPPKVDPSFAAVPGLLPRALPASNPVDGPDLGSPRQVVDTAAVNGVAGGLPGGTPLEITPSPPDRHPSAFAGSKGRGLRLLRRLSARAPGFDPTHTEGRSTSRGDCARDAGDWISAARYYRKALDYNPNNPSTWVQYGHAVKESGDPLAAEQAYRQALELDGTVADTHLQLGHALKIQGKKIEASLAYLHALALDPELGHASFELKSLGWTRGRIQLALRRERGVGQ